MRTVYCQRIRYGCRNAPKPFRGLVRYATVFGDLAMEELNELTKRLFKEGYDKEHYPEYVKPFNKWYGGFEYTVEAQRKLVFKTPCGLLVKGGYWNSGYMSYMGVDWCIENGNPTLNCPYSNAECTKRNELLKRITSYGRCMIVYCDCSLTDEAYDYERSIDKVKDTIEAKRQRQVDLR